MMTVEERYQNDPKFRTLVELLRKLISSAEFTPTELREALILAQTITEMNLIRKGVIL
jgi:hypothetical protein